MKTTAGLLLAAGTCGAGFLAGWLVFHSDSTCKIDLPPTQPLQRAESLAVRDAPDVGMPVSRVVVQPAAAEPPPSAPVAKPAEPAKEAAAIDPSDPRNLPETTLDEMTKKRDAIEAKLRKLSDPILAARFDDNLAEPTPEPDRYTYADGDDKIIMGLRKVPGQNMVRTVIPRSDYPDLYALKDETLRLGTLIEDTQRQQYVKQKPQ